MQSAFCICVAVFSTELAAHITAADASKKHMKTLNNVLHVLLISLLYIAYIFKIILSKYKDHL
jgi:hypothetical protein